MIKISEQISDNNNIKVTLVKNKKKLTCMHFQKLSMFVRTVRLFRNGDSDKREVTLILFLLISDQVVTRTGSAMFWAGILDS